MGDFNSRAGSLTDLVTNTEHVDSPFDCNIYDLPDRNSKDTHTNTMGYQLISFCKSCQLATANGRLRGDNPGNLTCKNASVVDYVLLSHCLFQYVKDFCVLEYNELYSDVHSPINIVFKCSEFNEQVGVKNEIDSHITTAKIPTDNKSMYTKWNDEHKDAYERKLNMEQISEVNIFLDTLLASKENKGVAA